MKIQASVGTASNVTSTGKVYGTGSLRYQWRATFPNGMIAGQFDTSEELPAAAFALVILAGARQYLGIRDNISLPADIGKRCTVAAEEALAARKGLTTSRDDE